MTAQEKLEYLKKLRNKKCCAHCTHLETLTEFNPAPRIIMWCVINKKLTREDNYCKKFDRYKEAENDLATD
jgi:hypothetical protein